MPFSLEAFQAHIGYQFKDRSLLSRALTHSSARASRADNERLEFLGDAALDLIIAKALYTRFPEVDEGSLDRGRASLVNSHLLAKKALELQIDDLLVVSESQRRHHAEPSRAMLEDAFEAVIGALFLDGGYLAVESTVLKLYSTELAELKLDESLQNAKGRLQEWAQQQTAKQMPVYQLVSTDGPDHARTFLVRVSHGERQLAEGRGSSKKAAEVQAAAAALRSLVDAEEGNDR